MLLKLLTSKLENKISVKILNNDKEIFGLLTKNGSYNIMFLSTEGELYCSYFFVFKMKVVKSQVILFMHEKLLMEGELYSEEVKEKFELEDKTFYSYIQEIKAYYCNQYKEEAIVYCRSEGKYVILYSVSVYARVRVRGFDPTNRKETFKA